MWENNETFRKKLNASIKTIQLKKYAFLRNGCRVLFPNFYLPGLKKVKVDRLFGYWVRYCGCWEIEFEGGLVDEKFPHTNIQWKSSNFFKDYWLGIRTSNAQASNETSRGFSFACQIKLPFNYFPMWTIVYINLGQNLEEWGLRVRLKKESLTVRS